MGKGNAHIQNNLSKAKIDIMIKRVYFPIYPCKIRFMKRDNISQFNRGKLLPKVPT